VKPRALPVRPDGLGSLGQGDADVDLGATVRAWDHAYPNGKASTNAGYGNGTFVPAANGTPFGPAANASGDEEELTVEELIAREDALLGGRLRVTFLRLPREPRIVHIDACVRYDVS
jgi:hypothetical protein